MKKFSLLFVILAMFVFLSGCSHPILSQKEYGELCSPSMRYQLIEQLQMSQVIVYRKGDSIILVTPQSNLFPVHSEYLLSSAQQALNLVAKYLACFQKISVRIVAYTNELSSAAANKALSTLRAKHIVNYLTEKRIDARLIAGVGVGGPTTVDVQVGARRIEIYTHRES